MRMSDLRLKTTDLEAQHGGRLAISIFTMRRAASSNVSPVTINPLPALFLVSEKRLLYISEIGLATDDVQATIRELVGHLMGKEAISVSHANAQISSTQK